MLRQLAVSALLASLLYVFGVARGAKPPTGDRESEIAAIVEQIAADGVYTTQYVGLAGPESPVYARFRRLVQIADRAQFAGLLRHPSPAVRYFVAEHYIEAYPHRAADVARLLIDGAEVRTTRGCVKGTSYVSGIVVFRLCERTDYQEVRRVLRAALSKPEIYTAPALGGLRVVGGSILECLAPHADPIVEKAARAIVAGTSGLASDSRQDKLLPDAIQALAWFGRASDLDLFLPFASHREGYVRSAFAFAIGKLKPRGAAKRLMPLLADDKCYVQSAAARSLTGLAGVPDSKIVDLLKKSDCVASGAGAGLAEQADERALRILRPYLLREGEGHYDTMMTLSRHKTASVRELMQVLLSSDHSMVVDLAREYLEASP